MAIVFQNRGLIDLDAIWVRGVSVKETDNPIGKFGTGFGYAVAVLLREGCSVELWRGCERYAFSAEPTTIRGKEFRVIHMNGQSLGFTTHLGHAWEPWQAYRELWCNAHDEPEGSVFRVDPEHPGGSEYLAHIGHPKLDSECDDLTRVVVTGAAIETAHRNRHETILQTEPLWVLAGLEVHAGPSDHIFYQGIRVAKLPKPAKFTYNLTTEQVLTEDRTLAHTWAIPSKVATAVVGATQRAFVTEVLSTKDDHFEGCMPYASIANSATPSDQFMEIANEMRLDKTLEGSGRNLFVAYADRLDRYGYKDPRLVEPTPAEQHIVDRARALLEQRGIDALGVHVVFRSGDTSIGQHRGILSLPAQLLQTDETQMALALIEGVAVVRGGSLKEQLIHHLLTGRWIDREEVDRRRRVEEFAF